MKEQIKKYRWDLLFSTLLILLPVSVGALLWNQTPSLPVFILATHWICLLLTFRDRKNKNQNPKVLSMVFWICPMTSLLSGSISYLMNSTARRGLASSFMLLMYFGFGLLFLICGNYFPKIRQNSTIGIKVKWALENEENWNATHRFAGKLWTVCGLIFMACGLFPDSSLVTVLFFLLILVAAIVPCIYSYRYYQKQVREGLPDTIHVNWKVTVLLTGLVLVFLYYTLFTGNMEISYGDTSLTVETGNWSDLTIAYEEIREIQYFDQDPSDAVDDGMRTNGFGNLKLALGQFQNSLYGDYTRYTYVRCDACVILNVNGETVVLNGPDADATRQIYQQILEKVEKMDS